MAVTKKCVICGAEYEYCKTFRPTSIFRWQDVACCPEHGGMYFAKVLESRGQEIPEEVAALVGGAAKSESTADVQKNPATEKKTKSTRKQKREE